MMKTSLPDYLKIAPFLVFFLIHGSQTGSGLLSFQRIIAKEAGYDAWIAVIVAGLSVHFILFIIYKLVEIVDGDLIDIHTFVFGNLLSKLFNFSFFLYLLLCSIMVINTYIEIVQVWIFPDLNLKWFAFAILILVFYIVNGGFRVITGVAFFGVILPMFIYLTILFTIKYADFRNLLPIMDHSFQQILTATYRMSLSFIGYELLLIYYPYIDKKRQSKIWAHLGILTTTLLYVYFAVFTFAYFSEGQLQLAIWPTLTMWKIIRFPLIERFEYIGIAIWLIMIIPNLAVLIWSSARILKKSFKIKFSKSLIGILFTCFFISIKLESFKEIEQLKDIVSKIGLVVTYIYLPVLLILMLIMKKVKKH